MMSHESDQTGQTAQKIILIAVTDLFFYTKIRDALLPKGYRLERARSQEDIAEKASLAPAAVVLNMNDDVLDAVQALKTMKADARIGRVPILAFANHEEIETWKKAKGLGVTKIVSRNEFSSRTRELIEGLLLAETRQQPTSS